MISLHLTWTVVDKRQLSMGCRDDMLIYLRPHALVLTGGTYLIPVAILRDMR